MNAGELKELLAEVPDFYTVSSGVSDRFGDVVEYVFDDEGEIHRLFLALRVNCQKCEAVLLQVEGGWGGRR